MDLKFSGERLESVEFEHTLLLEFTGDNSVRIGSSSQISVQPQTGDLAHLPADNGASVTVNDFVGAIIASATADQDTGLLVLTFEDGRKLAVPANGHYEAWEYGGPNGRDVFCKPSGGLDGFLGDLEPDH